MEAGMKSRILVFFIFSILAQLIISGCANTNSLLETPIGKTPAAPTVDLVSLTMQSTRGANNTPSSSLAPTLPATLAPTPDYIVTPAPKIIATLSVDIARDKLLDLLITNGNCRLPCLWGITPGKTTSEEAITILIPLSSISDFTKFTMSVGNIAPYYAEGNLKTYVNIGFLTSEDIINRVSFEGRELEDIIDDQSGRGVVDVFDSEIFGKRLSLFMLPQILTEYGRPNSVMLSTLAEAPPSRYGQGHFHILVVYPDRGIFIHYTSKMQVKGEYIIGCPSNAHVEIELFPPGSGVDLQELLAPSGWLERMSYYSPIEDVTSMDIDEFYLSFRTSTEECIYTAAKYWPLPER